MIKSCEVCCKLQCTLLHVGGGNLKLKKIDERRVLKGGCNADKNMRIKDRRWH